VDVKSKKNSAKTTKKTLRAKKAEPKVAKPEKLKASKIIKKAEKKTR
jgi:hypothetical protein